MVFLCQIAQSIDSENNEVTCCCRYPEATGPVVVADEAAVSSVLGQMFRIAVLLTASVERGETALLEAIQSLHHDDSLTDGLLRGTVRASLRAAPVGVPEQREEELRQASSMLPTELQHVLRLSGNLRQCFVLRLFVGLSRNVCARLVGADLRQIDEYTFAAARELSAVINYRALQSV